MPPGADVTVPLPVPAFATLRVYAFAPIVPCPCPFVRVAPAGVLKLTKNVLAARRVALMTWTVTVWVVVPGVKERVPAVAT
jgi:hypothetical protein